MIKVTGRGEAYFETGTEGVLWAVYDPNEKGYNGLYILKDGDELNIYDKNAPDNILWSGIIKLEYETYKQVLNKKYNTQQQSVCGFWVHGLQEGVDGTTWGEYFLKEYPMTLVKSNEFRYILSEKTERPGFLAYRKTSLRPLKIDNAIGFLTMEWKYYQPSKIPNASLNVPLTREVLENLRDTINNILKETT
jgi:hypothetical protein